jgi:putative ABC transport system permease protein
MQFFLEAVLACLLSGLLGFVLGAIGIELLSGVPLPAGFSSPQLDLRTAGLSFGILAVIAVAAGVFPARRAALLVPVEALKEGQRTRSLRQETLRIRRRPAARPLRLCFP